MPLTIITKLTECNYKHNGDNNAIGYINGIPVIFKWDLKQMHVHYTSLDDKQMIKDEIDSYLSALRANNPNSLALNTNIFEFIIEFYEV